MTSLVFKWSVSRARDTAGYNICSLWVNGKKVSSYNGGGYDMQGTVLGDWVARAFRSDLIKLKESFYGLSFHDPSYDPGKAIVEGETVEDREKAGKTIGLDRYQAFHSASSKVPTERHTIPLINGATGQESVERILKAIGYRMKYVHASSNVKTYDLVRISDDKEE